ncbi:hypothetical protein D3C80_523060 [compost metagenome]
MGALLDDVPFIHHDQPVHGRNRRQPVGDGDDGLALHHFIQALLNGHLHFRVQRTGGFVQQQDRRVLQHHPGNGDALALATRQLDAALSHQGVVTAVALAVAELADETIGLGAGRSGADLRLGRIGAAIGDVVANRAVQQRGVLGDHADGAAQAVLGDLGHVLPVDADFPTVHVVETQQQVDQGGLASAGAADQTDFFARADVQAQVVEYLTLAVVVEADLVETHRAPLGYQLGSAGRIRYLGAAGEGGHAVLHGADVFEQRGYLPHDPVRHAVDTQGHGGDRRHRPGADLAQVPQPQRIAAGSNDQAHHQRLVDDFELADQTHLAKTGLLEVLHGCAREVRFAVGVREQFHRGDVGVGVRNPPGHR